MLKYMRTLWNPNLTILSNKIVVCSTKKDIILRKRILQSLRPEFNDYLYELCDQQNLLYNAEGDNNLVLLAVGDNLHLYRKEIEAAVEIAGKNGKIILIAHRLVGKPDSCNLDMLYLTMLGELQPESLEIITSNFWIIKSRSSVDMSHIPHYFRPLIMKQENKCLLVWPENLNVDIMFKNNYTISFAVQLDHRVRKYSSEYLICFTEQIQKHNESMISSMSYLLNITNLAPKSMKAIEIGSGFGVFVEL